MFFYYFQVLDVVRAAEMLVNKPSSPTEMIPPKSPGGSKTADLKTTTIVMSKHTLAPQTSTVSDFFLHIILFQIFHVYHPVYKIIYFYALLI